MRSHDSHGERVHQDPPPAPAVRVRRGPAPAARGFGRGGACAASSEHPLSHSTAAPGETEHPDPDPTTCSNAGSAPRSSPTGCCVPHGRPRVLQKGTAWSPAPARKQKSASDVGRYQNIFDTASSAQVRRPSSEGRSDLSNSSSPATSAHMSAGPATAAPMVYGATPS